MLHRKKLPGSGEWQGAVTRMARASRGVMFAIAELCGILLAQHEPSVNLDEGREKEELCPLPGPKFVDKILEVILKQDFLSSVESRSTSVAG